MLGNIINQIESYNPNADLDIVVKAYNFSEMAHSNAQTRFSGERYFTHPYNVALILADLHMDVQTICAGLLHDVVEDTGITVDDIKKNSVLKLPTWWTGLQSSARLNTETRKNARPNP